ncbi:hypothetical protein KUCAC02_032708 [Chaenocephalus aceratus]|nr:hypothetical protein KUCAC02_032708 [Chaenocephalus aceratus]
MQRRRRRCSNPKDDAKCYIDTGGDKAGLDVQYINATKGRGIFTSIPFQTGDFLIEYRGELISQQECETRLKRYPVGLKGFMFKFHFDGILWCVDAAKENESLGRLVNDDHRNPTAKMKRLSVQGKPHLCLFADRDISPGEEITYNYGDSDWPWRCKQDLDEVMPLETCEATEATSPDENIEEMVTNSDCTEATESYTKTAGQVFSPLSRAEKHCLRIATVSSLDRCASCVGPVSSSKWLGYECRECSQVWHQSCFRNLQDDDLHYLPKQPSENSFRDELQSNQSDSKKDQISDECMSGEEYIPDSQGDDDDSDASIPLMPSQSKAGRIQFETLTDVGKNYPSDTSLPVLPSTSEDWPPLDIDATTSGPSISNKDSYKKKPKAKAELPKHLTLSTKNYCFVCGKPQSKISRHLRTHTTHAEIIHAFSLPEHSKERKILIEKMRNKGNFKNNTEVLKSGTGKLKVKRKPKAEAPAGKFIHCMHCKGLYIRKDLWRHVRRCPCKPEGEEDEEKPARTKVLGLASAQESVLSQQISSGVWKLLNAMRQDEVASVVRNDFSIIQFAQSLYSKHGQDPTKYEYIRQKLREVGRLLLCLQTEFSVYNLEEAVKPANFQRVVQAVKNVSGFDDKHHTYSTPSLALKLGHTLLKINDIIHCRALMAEDDELIKSTKMFEKLYTSKSSEFVSHGALSGAKYNKPSTLPFTEDVQVLHRHLDKSAESAICNLKEEATPQNYAELAKVALAQVIVFNRRRTEEVSKMHLKHFNERDDAELHQDVAKGLSKTEQRLCNYFSRVEIPGKRGRKVAVLLSPSMLDALSLLVSKRTECGVCSTNVFLFARPKCMSCYRGQDCLRLHASKCGAKHPEHLRLLHLRKHVATLSQVLHLKNNELDQVADFRGHDIRVHQDFYRLPVPTTQLAKISKLLLSMEKGQLSSIRGKSLDEIDIEDEISFSDAEDVNSDSDDDDETAAPACGTSQPVTAASIDRLAEPVSSTVSEPAPPSEGKDHKKARNTMKKAWAKNEVAAVMRHFKLFIAQGHLATKSECQHCKMVEGKVLDERTVQNIRDFVRNRGIARKRQSQ